LRVLLPPTEGLLVVPMAVQVIEGLVGLAVNGLPATAALLGESCDVAVAAVEDSSGAGQAVAGC